MLFYDYYSNWINIYKEGAIRDVTLLFAGVSVIGMARRLGHASMTTTRKTYLHVIQELENKNTDLGMKSISGLT